MTDLVVVAQAAWTGDGLRGPVAVAVERGVVSWIGPPADAPAGERRKTEGVLLPGLIDHHVHSGLVDLSGADGLTTVVDLGWIPEEIWPKARASEEETATGPRILAAGPFLTARGGYPTDREWAPEGIAWELEDPDDARDAVRTLARFSPVTIKVSLNAVSLNDEDCPVLDDETLAAITATAHEHGLDVTAHAEGPGQVRRALEAGVDRLAHTPWTEELSDDLLAAVARSMTVISTVDIHGWGARTPERSTALSNLRRFHALRGRVRYGTDLGNGPLPCGVNEREIAALSEAGMAPANILGAITSGPLAPGAQADLASTPADPLADPACLAQATTVVRGGRT